MKDKTLLVIAPGRDVTSDALFHLLVAETGEHLASHLCSHYGFAKGDLYENRPERIEKFTNRFGDIEVKFIDETDITEEQLLERNKNWYEEQQKES
jgi:hypothetical protein